jgi:hypothetical protein
MNIAQRGSPLRIGVRELQPAVNTIIDRGVQGQIRVHYAAEGTGWDSYRLALMYLLRINFILGFAVVIVAHPIAGPLPAFKFSAREISTGARYSLTR